jgi:hypothetical protein
MTIIDSNTVIPMGLLFETTYFWRVKAINTVDTSDWSDVWSFTTINQVNLVSPADSTFDPNPSPTLEWQQITGITGYELLYDVTETFETAEQVFVDEPAHKHTVLAPLEKEETYYWKVRAYKTVDTTMWSEIWQFTVDEADTTDIAEILNKHSVQILPNPCKVVLQVQTNLDKAGTVEITILNVLGQPVFSTKDYINAGRAKKYYSLDDLSNGMYIIQLKSGNSTYNQRLIIDK